jgi:hypothetical protein
VSRHTQAGDFFHDDRDNTPDFTGNDSEFPGCVIVSGNVISGNVFTVLKPEPS